MLTTAYVVNLPWKVWPSTERLHVSAQFQLPDGRVFGADRDVTVRVTPTNRRPAAAPGTNPTPGFPPTPRPTEEGGPLLLPPPRTIDPGKNEKPAPAGNIPAPFSAGLRETSAHRARREHPPPSLTQTRQLKRIYSSFSRDAQRSAEPSRAPLRVAAKPLAFHAGRPQTDKT